MQVGDGVLLTGEADITFCRTEQDLQFTQGATSPTSHLGFILKILGDGRYICAQATTEPRAGMGALPPYNPGVFDTPGVHLETARADERAVVCTRFFLLVEPSAVVPYRPRSHDLSPVIKQESVQYLRSRFKYRQLEADIQQALKPATIPEFLVETAQQPQAINIRNPKVYEPASIAIPTQEVVEVVEENGTPGSATATSTRSSVGQGVWDGNRIAKLFSRPAAIRACA